MLLLVCIKIPKPTNILCAWRYHGISKYHFDQPMHSRSPIRVFTGRILGSQGCGQRKLLLECPNAQADLNFRLALLLEGTFSHEAAQNK